MKVLSSELQIAVKNILLATDFQGPASRALPYAVALAERHHAKLYLSHVIPHEAYAFASPESLDSVLKEAEDFTRYTLNQIISPLRRHNLDCDALVGEGAVSESIHSFLRQYCIDLLVLGTSCRGGVGKALLGSVSEELIRQAPCPVLTVGTHVNTSAATAVRIIVCATDFSPASSRAVEFAAAMACECSSHLTLLHVLEGKIHDSPNLAIQMAEKRLREALPPETELQYAPEVVVETGAVADRIVALAIDLSADLIVMGAHGAGAFAQTASHLGSIAHKVLCLAPCPVLTLREASPNPNEKSN